MQESEGLIRRNYSRRVAAARESGSGEDSIAISPEGLVPFGEPTAGQAVQATICFEVVCYSCHLAKLEATSSFRYNRFFIGQGGQEPLPNQG